MELAASGNRLRALVGRQRIITEQENAYGEKVDKKEFNELLDQAILEEYERSRVLLALEEKPNSVKDIAAEIDVDPSIVLEHMLILKSRMLVDFKEIIGITPIYMRT